MDSLRIALAQLNTVVGDLSGNAQKIIHALEHAKDTHPMFILAQQIGCGKTGGKFGDSLRINPR